MKYREKVQAIGSRMRQWGAYESKENRVVGVYERKENGAVMYGF